jgi:hypothetical protein
LEVSSRGRRQSVFFEFARAEVGRLNSAVRTEAATRLTATHIARRTSHIARRIQSVRPKNNKKK